MKTTNEVNETTETLKKLAITSESEGANSQQQEQQLMNGNETSTTSSCNGEKLAAKESSATSWIHFNLISNPKFKKKTYRNPNEMKNI